MLSDYLLELWHRHHGDGGSRGAFREGIRLAMEYPGADSCSHPHLLVVLRARLEEVRQFAPRGINEKALVTSAAVQDPATH